MVTKERVKLTPAFVSYYRSDRACVFIGTFSGADFISPPVHLIIQLRLLKLRTIYLSLKCF